MVRSSRAPRPHCNRKRRTWRLILRAAGVVALTLPAAAQDQDRNRVPPVLDAFEVGRTLPLPGAPEEEIGQSLSCDMICSPFVPRQTIAMVNWHDDVQRQPQPDVADAGLRLDIALASASFDAGTFGTLSIDRVPELDEPSAVEISPQEISTTLQPVAFQRVENNRVVARPSALPPPDVLLQERVPGAMDRIGAPALEAMEVDLQDGGIGRLQAIAQVTESRRGEPTRALVVEGLQPGLTYRMRLVAERPESAQTVDSGICRVPVCPADFAN